MEVISPNGSPTPTIDQFNFNGLRVSPYLSAPSSPKRFGDYNNYLSAPTSPSRFYNDFDYFSPSASPSIPIGDDDDDSGFAFFVSRESDTPSRSAEELFDGGKIKPLEKDHQLYESARSPLLSPNRPKRSALAQGKKAIVEAFSSSPRSKKESRGRDPTPVVATAAATSEISVSRSGRRVSRSHSPYRISNWEEGESNKEDSSSSSSSISLSKSSSKSSRKWRLRDFLLFRSASEGRGTSKDPFRKYPVLYKKAGEDGKASPLRSSDNNTTTKLRRKEPVVSAHELHYARKKAESEDMKKRTFLPYKQGILGRLAGLGSNNR